MTFCQFGSCIIECNPNAPNGVTMRGYFDIHDLAERLASSRLQRFGGAFPNAWSVAKHSVAVSKVMHVMLGSPQMALHGLLHDAPEAFLGDICGPLKGMLGPSVVKLEQDLQDKVYAMLHMAHMGANTYHPSTVKYYDKQCLIFEIRELQKSTATEGDQGLAPARTAWLAEQDIDEATQKCFAEVQALDRDKMRLATYRDDVVRAKFYQKEFVRQFHKLTTELLK